jgi:uncharacterized membrane protein
MITLTTLFPVALVGVMNCLLPALVAPTVPFGVRIPADRVGEPVVRRQRRIYFWTVGTVTVAATVGAYFGPLWLVPIIAVAIVPIALVCYAFARHAIKSAKAAGNWYAGLTQATATDTTWRSQPLQFPWLWALPSLAILLATVVTGAVRYSNLPDRLAIHFNANGVADRYVSRSPAAAFVGLWPQLFITALVVVLLLLTYRSRPETDAADPAGSTDRYRRFLSRFARVILVMIALVNATMLLASLQIWQLVPVNSSTIGLTSALPIVGVVLLLAVALRTGQAGVRLNGRGAATTSVVNRDDDRYWKGGLIYVNRGDPAVVVPRRFGIGWTFNFAHPLAWLILAAIVGAIFAIKTLSR